MNFNLEYYRAFFAVANLLSFTKAAQQLCLTQPAVSHSVRKLETELGCKLFIRLPSGLKLTNEGLILYDHVRKAFAELHTGENTVLKLAEFKTGELQIGATETALRFFLAPLIKDFQKSFPNIHISFIGSTTTETCRKLQDHEIEVAFLMEPVPKHFHFQMTEIQKVQDIFVADSRFPIDQKKCFSLSELCKYPLIYVDQQNDVRSYIDNWFLQYHLLFTPEFTVKSTGLIVPLVENQLGIGIIPKNFVQPYLQSGQFLQIHTRELPPPRKMYLAVNPDIPISAISEQFIQFMDTNKKEAISK